jgi:hypothetical protein
VSRFGDHCDVDQRLDRFRTLEQVRDLRAAGDLVLPLLATALRRRQFRDRRCKVLKMTSWSFAYPTAAPDIDPSHDLPTEIFRRLAWERLAL